MIRSCSSKYSLFRVEKVFAIDRPGGHISGQISMPHWHLCAWHSLLWANAENCIEINLQSFLSITDKDKPEKCRTVVTVDVWMMFIHLNLPLICWCNEGRGCPIQLSQKFCPWCKICVTWWNQKSDRIKFIVWSQHRCNEQRPFAFVSWMHRVQSVDRSYKFTSFKAKSLTLVQPMTNPGLSVFSISSYFGIMSWKSLRSSSFLAVCVLSE